MLLEALRQVIIADTLTNCTSKFSFLLGKSCLNIANKRWRPNTSNCPVSSDLKPASSHRDKVLWMNSVHRSSSRDTEKNQSLSLFPEPRNSFLQKNPQHPCAEFETMHFQRQDEEEEETLCENFWPCGHEDQRPRGRRRLKDDVLERIAFVRG